MFLLNNATFLCFLRTESRQSGNFEDFTNTILRFSRTLEVGDSSDLFRHGTTLFWLKRFLFHLRRQLYLGCLVVTKICLVAYEDYGDIGTEVLYLGRPSFINIRKAIGSVDREAHQYDVSIGV